MSLRSRCRSRSSSLTCLLLALVALATACGGGGSGGGSTGGTGSVGVLVTDGPVDPEEFSHIFVTFTEITLIGEGGHVTIFEGEQVVDLRDLEDTATFLAVGRDVPANEYEKIRLDVSEIELVSAEDDSSSFPKLPPKIDLNPQGGFRVRSGEVVFLQIDMDMEKSIHIVETGNQQLRFRPVIFVDVLVGSDLGKLVLLRGEVEEVGSGGFLLCDTHSVSHEVAGARTTMQLADTGSDPHDDFCVDVRTDGGTSFFDENGDPGSLDDVDPGDHAAVLGLFDHEGELLVFDAEVVQLGEDELAADGVIDSEVDASDRFDLLLDPGQDVGGADGVLQIQLQAGTRIFDRAGNELAPGEIEVGDPAQALGVLSSSDPDVLKAAFVIVDVGAEDEAVEGEIASVESSGARIHVDTATQDGVCVDVPSGAGVFLVTMSGGGSDVEAITRSQLQVGDLVSVFGFDQLGCFEADTVIVVDEE